MNKKTITAGAATVALSLLLSAGVALAQAMPSGTQGNTSGSYMNGANQNNTGSTTGNESSNTNNGSSNRTQQGVGGSGTMPSGAPSTGFGGNQ